MELNEACPYCCDELIPPDLIKIVNWSLRNVSEKFHNPVRRCSKGPDQFMANEKNQKPEKINQVDDNDSVKRPCKVNIDVILCQWVRRLLANV
jgi:hypothetical protein